MTSTRFAVVFQRGGRVLGVTLDGDVWMLREEPLMNSFVEWDRLNEQPGSYTTMPPRLP